MPLLGPNIGARAPPSSPNVTGSGGHPCSPESKSLTSVNTLFINRTYKAQILAISAPSTAAGSKGAQAAA
jgi:hypothetical protein